MTLRRGPLKEMSKARVSRTGRAFVRDCRCPKEAAGAV